MDTINVSGLSREKLLRELWKNTPYAPYYILNNIDPPHFDIEKAKNDIKKRSQLGYADYICGKPIKCYIFGESDEINPQNYDRDAGKGTFQKVVNQMKMEMQ
jgi:hypothetical protein